MVRSTWSGRAWVRVMSSAVVAIVPLRFLTAGRGELFDAGPHLDRSELADLAAGVALDAVAHVDDVGLFLLATDAADGALLGAERAAGADLGVDVVRDQRLALARRAAPLADVRVQLIAEVAQGSEHRVGRRSTESAERAFDDVARELLQQLEVSLTSISLSDALQSFQHALGAQPTGHALAARLVLRELQDESCGKCVPCRLGTKRMLETLERITEGNGREGDLELLEELSGYIMEGSLCALGGTAPNPVLTTLRYFRDELDAHISERRCPAGQCKALITYYIDAEVCTGCTLCAKKCPVSCISGEKKQPHVIDVSNCIKCDTCRQVCKFAAVKVWSGIEELAAASGQEA